MRHALLALGLIMAFTSCGTRPDAPRDGGYELRVTNHHHDDVVIYLYRGQRQRLGRIRGVNGKETYHLTESDVRSGPAILVCIGNFRPGGPCFMTHRMTGAYPGEHGEPGVVHLVVQRGINGVAAVLNG